MAKYNNNPSYYIRTALLSLSKKDDQSTLTFILSLSDEKEQRIPSDDDYFSGM